jgi:hypothetical protein
MAWEFTAVTEHTSYVFSVGPDNKIISAGDVVKWALGQDANAVLSYWRNMGAQIQMYTGA